VRARHSAGSKRLPIHSWQIWNEPNLRAYWASGVSASGYTRLLAAVGSAINHVDRRAEIVAAGLPQSRRGVSFERFVAGIYKAGGRSAFDTLAVHPYARGSRGVIGAARLARRPMNRRHDRRGRIWITELGWATGGPKSAFRVGSRGQTSRIRSALRGLAKRRSKLRLRGVVYFKWRDTRHPVGADFFGTTRGC
jgi:polysaccharide biosynthesis protein PslG